MAETIGLLLAGALGRWAPQPRATFTWAAVALTVASFIPSLTTDTDTATDELDKALRADDVPPTVHLVARPGLIGRDELVTASVGTPAADTASVRCVVNLADLAVPGVPGTRTVTATASSPVDTFRERQ